MPAVLPHAHTLLFQAGPADVRSAITFPLGTDGLQCRLCILQHDTWTLEILTQGMNRVRCYPGRDDIKVYDSVDGPLMIPPTAMALTPHGPHEHLYIISGARKYEIHVNGRKFKDIAWPPTLQIR